MLKLYEEVGLVQFIIQDGVESFTHDSINLGISFDDILLKCSQATRLVEILGNTRYIFELTIIPEFRLSANCGRISMVANQINHSISSFDSIVNKIEKLRERWEKVKNETGIPTISSEPKSE